MKKGVMICTLEMPASQIVDRMVAQIGRVSMRSLSEGVKSERDLDGIQRALSVLDFADLAIRDDLYDIRSICAAARVMAKSPCGLKILMVDYIQLVRCNVNKNASREQEVAEVSRMLRLLSIELGCLVIALTQLNKQGGARESQAIEQDATCIMVVKEKDEHFREISIPRQRNGPSSVSTELGFNGRTASFYEPK